MKVTIFRKRKKGDGETIANEEFNDFIERIKTDTREEYIIRYREVYLGLDHKDSWMYYNRIPKVCPMSEYLQKQSGEREFRLYNGISMIVVDNLNNEVEIEKIKRQSALIPQVLCTFEGADGHSAIIWTLATLPDGRLPKDEKLAELFCALCSGIRYECDVPDTSSRIQDNC